VMGGGGCGSGTIAYESLHWDGDNVLFTTNAQGAVDDIKMGLIADYTPIDSVYQGLTITDRDPSGAPVGMHNSSGHGASLSAPQPMKQGYNFTGACFAQAPAGFCKPNQSVGYGQLLIFPSSDGFWDGFNKIQGVRSYDAEIGAWATPDEFQGFVDAPMTQKPYAWNGNNPLLNSDPTGFNFGFRYSGTILYSGDSGAYGGLDVYGHGPHNDGLQPARPSVADVVVAITYPAPVDLDCCSPEQENASTYNERREQVFQQLLPQLIQAGNAYDRAGFTRAGRALQKHSNRQGSVFKRPVDQSPSGYNTAGQQALKDIMEDPRLTVMRNKYGGVDFFSQNGAGPGARFGPAGPNGEPTFMGFLEP
jgi:hypothetical protein